MKKLLVVGGGYAEIPLIEAAKKMDFYVITTGNKPNDMGHNYSNEYINVDFSDKEAIYELAKKEKVDAICAGCNDFALLSASYTAEKLNLPGYDNYKISNIIHHKDKYREFAMNNNINTPQAIGICESGNVLEKIKDLSYPLIIKPVDLTGGKGISIVNSENELSDAVKKALDISKAKRVVIEEFIEGTRHGFSAFLCKGKIVFDFSDNEQYYMNPYLVSAASTPSIASEEVEKKLRIESEKIAFQLSLKDGIFHIQYILNKNEEPVIIEICRRPPGDLYIKFVEYATGLDYSSWILKGFLGEDCESLRQKNTNGYFIRHCIMGNENGTLKNIYYDERIKINIIDKMSWWKKGDIIENYMVHKHGIVFLKFDTIEEMNEKSKKLNELIKVEMEK
jgi:biotin carboxylase